MFGTEQWLDILGEEMERGFHRNPPAPGTKTSFLEYYRGGPLRADGSSWAFRVDVDGPTSFTYRKGVQPDEVADVAVHLDFEVAAVLAAMLTDDENYRPTIDDAVAKSRFVLVSGDTQSLGWLAGVHDAVVERTR